jgi:hypothetical protein
MQNRLWVQITELKLIVKTKHMINFISRVLSVIHFSFTENLVQYL